MRICVLVHPGSIFTSGAQNVSPEILGRVTSGLLEDIHAADGLLVIDGAFSDRIPHVVDTEICEALHRAQEKDFPSFRIWGCDSGEMPYAGWRSHSGGIFAVNRSQEEAAERLISYISHAEEIVVTGAWANREEMSGCVNSVARVFEGRLPGMPVRISPKALFEQDMESPGL